MGVNTPFSNAKTVDTPACCKALMVEVNKALYMDEMTLGRSASFGRVASDLQSL